MVKVPVNMFLINFIAILILCRQTNTQFFDNVNIHIYRNDMKLELISATTINDEKYVTDISIDGQHIPILKKGSFENLLKVETLKLLTDDIEVIEKGTFINLPKLRFINLNKNRLTTLTNDIFNRLDLTKLTINSNNINHIDYDTFHNLSMLEELDLSSNSIKVLPTSMFRNTQNLRIINFSWNKIESIPSKFFSEAFQNSVNGQETTIDLSNNHISYIHPDALRSICCLKNLFLNDNQIKTLDDSLFNDLSFLDSINLESNFLEIIGDSVLGTFFKLSSEINLDGNNLNCTMVDRIYKYADALQKLSSLTLDATFCSNKRKDDVSIENTTI